MHKDTDTLTKALARARPHGCALERRRATTHTLQAACLYSGTFIAIQSPIESASVSIVTHPHRSEHTPTPSQTHVHTHTHTGYHTGVPTHASAPGSAE